MGNQDVLLLDISRSDAGHRGQYFAFLGRLLNGQRVPADRAALFARQPVLVAMIEESFGTYVAFALIRALLGRRTAGLLFRPLPVVDAVSGRMRFKRAVLRLLRHVPGVRTLTILPFSVDARFASIAHDWIYDPQFWDLYADEGAPAPAEPGPLAAGIRAQAAGRKVCSAMGRQDRAKGFDLFASLYAGDGAVRERMLFAYGGKVDAALAGMAADFAQAGGHGTNRFISDEELFDLYAAADLVWCCYAPDYDQASGIFGRAMQTGIPVVVRAGSLIHRFAQMEGLPHIAYDPAAGAAPFDHIPARGDLAEAARRARAHGAQSRARLRGALGLDSGAQG